MQTDILADQQDPIRKMTIFYNVLYITIPVQWSPMKQA